MGRARLAAGIGAGVRRRLVVAGMIACLAGLALAGGAFAALPDGRVYELVSPLEKNGGSAGVTRGSKVQYALAAADGGALFYGEGPSSVGNNYGANEDGFQLFSVSARSAGEWSTWGVLPAPNQPVTGAATQLRDALPSADFSRLAIGSFSSLGAGPEKALDLLGSDGSAAWLSRPAITDPISSDPPLVDGASGDLDRIYFGYAGTLLSSDDAPNAALGGASRKSVVNTGNPNAIGFYEWTPDGGLSYAGVLPDGSVDPYGALPAQLDNIEIVNTPFEFNANGVSSDGSRAFFLSPSPHASPPASDPPELYVRETAPDGSQRTVLVSGSALTGQPAVDSPLVGGGSTSMRGYVYASADGSHVFFEDVDALTVAAPNDGRIKKYEFDTQTNTLSYLPGFADQQPQPTMPGCDLYNPFCFLHSPILTSSADGSRALFLKETPAGFSLDLFSGAQITPVAQFPSEEGRGGEGQEVGRYRLPEGRASADGSVFVFETSSPIYSQSPGQFNNGGGFEQIYRYEVPTGQLSCLSCGPASLGHTGNANISNDTYNGTAMLDSRGISGDASRVFFDTPDALVPQDVNGRRDVYEWEQDGSGGCGEAAGCLRLISSGRSANDSYFLDNSASGGDVFFATTQGLVAQDGDGAYDIYDARVGGGFPAPAVPPSCSEEACQGAPGVPPSLLSPASVAFSGAGNAAPDSGAAGATTAQVKARGGVVHGSAFLLGVEVPGAGRVTIAGVGVRTAVQSFAAAGAYRVRVTLTASQRRTLKRRRRLRLALRVAYAPASGPASSVAVSITDKA